MSPVSGKNDRIQERLDRDVHKTGSYCLDALFAAVKKWTVY